MLGAFVFKAYAQAVFCHGVDVARGPVDLHVLTRERPVPRTLDDGLCVWVLEEDGGVVIDLGVDTGFDLQRNGGDAAPCISHVARSTP